MSAVLAGEGHLEIFGRLVVRPPQAGRLRSSMEGGLPDSPAVMMLESNMIWRFRCVLGGGVVHVWECLVTSQPPGVSNGTDIKS